MKRKIVISRMYAGKYLTENLGHEIINLFKADNGKNYIYLNDVGTFGKEHMDASGICAIESILLVRTLYRANTVEVLGVAEGLHPVYFPIADNSDIQKLYQSQKTFVNDNEIKYGGANLCDIFCNEPTPGVLITFEADKVLLVNKEKHIFIRFADKQNTAPREVETFENDILVKLQDVKLGHELKSYVSESDIDWTKLQQLINDNANWGEEIPMVSLKDAPEVPSLLSVCKMEDSELAYSNAIAYFAQKYPALTQDFGQKLAHSSVLGRVSLTIERETGHTDILMYSSGHCVVIENKIKSGINGIVYDENGNIVKTQLNEYIEFALNFIKDKGLKVTFPRFYLLVPDYHPITRYHENPINNFIDYINVGKGIHSWRVVTYSQLYKYLLPKTKKAPYSKDNAFKEFVKSLEKHTHIYDDSIYDEMCRRFYERISAIVDWR